MDISRKTDYALRMLTALVREPSGVISVRTAADANGVPYSFARSIQRDLAESGIVESLRGAHGGMRLVRAPSRVTLLAIVEAMQGPLVLSACESCGPECSACPRMDLCRLNPIWRGAQELLESYLGSVTLEDIVLGRAKPMADERFCRPGGSGVPSL